MKKAFITGVTGQDGSYLSELLLEKGYDVFGLVRISSINNTERLYNVINNKNFHIVYGDMTDEASLYRIISAVLPDEIYNFAAQSHVGLSAKFSEYTANVNALGLLRLVNVVKSLNLEQKVKIYNAASSEIFGNGSEKIFDENSALNPVTPYACAKAYAYLLAKSFRRENIFIVNGVAFPHESPRRPDKFVTRKVTKSAVRIKLGKQDKLYLGNLDVQKDWGHSKDYVKAMWLSLQQDKSDDYIFCTGILTSLKDFCIKTFKQLSIDLEFKGVGVNEKAFDKNTGKVLIEINPEFIRKSENVSPKGNNKKAKDILHWQPKYTIDDIIKEMVEEDYKIESR